MIPFDFEYYRPTTLTEATYLYQSLRKQEKNILYYSGGTEFITFARMNKILTEAVIDIKEIPECKCLEIQDSKIVIGAAVTLNEISESGLFPLLGENLKQIADHTSRNKITIGGNLNSQLIYREGLLPLLLADAEVIIANHDGASTVPLRKIFHERLEINDGDLLVKILINNEYANLPFKTIKKTKSTKIGYPIVSIAGLVKDKAIRIALSGVCNYPFRCTEWEQILNDHTISMEDRVRTVITNLPEGIIDDLQASANYRKFVLENTLLETMEALEGYAI